MALGRKWPISITKNFRIHRGFTVIAQHCHYSSTQTQLSPLNFTKPVSRNAALIALIVDELTPRSFSKLVTVLGITLAFNPNSRTVQLSPALAILHCFGVIMIFCIEIAI